MFTQTSNVHIFSYWHEDTEDGAVSSVTTFYVRAESEDKARKILAEKYPNMIQEDFEFQSSL